MKDFVGRRYDHRPDHYRFPRQIQGFYPENEKTSATAWLASGAAVGALILAALFFYGA